MNTDLENDGKGNDRQPGAVGTKEWKIKQVLSDTFLRGDLGSRFDIKLAVRIRSDVAAALPGNAVPSDQKIQESYQLVKRLMTIQRVSMKDMIGITLRRSHDTKDLPQ